MGVTTNKKNITIPLIFFVLSTLCDVSVPDLG